MAVFASEALSVLVGRNGLRLSAWGPKAFVLIVRLMFA
jgi:hypothetical protein